MPLSHIYVPLTNNFMGYSNENIEHVNAIAFVALTVPGEFVCLRPRVSVRVREWVSD